MASAESNPKQPTAKAVYGSSTGPVALRIGTGGAGESGLLEALAEAFLALQDKNAAIEWYTTHTSDSINYLQQGIVDIAITYHAIAELSAVEAGVVERVEYAWRDHWMLVGPKSNPAHLPTDSKSTIYALFTKLWIAMEAAKATLQPIKFLSRYDRSANNIRDSVLWATIGQTPWVSPASPWYHMSHSFPFDAIRTAAELGEYTLTDRGTWCAIEPGVREKLDIFAQGSGAETDPLLNPAHLLVGAGAKNGETANAFADWMVREDGGQRVIGAFEKHGMVLYERIPGGVDPLGIGKGLLG